MFIKGYSTPRKLEQKVTQTNFHSFTKPSPRLTRSNSALPKVKDLKEIVFNNYHNRNFDKLELKPRRNTKYRALEELKFEPIITKTNIKGVYQKRNIKQIKT
ncbi:hypothetical protein pb186bvf_017777 [Paramecium bursaria]